MPPLRVADQYDAQPNVELTVDSGLGLLANDMNPDQVDLAVGLLEPPEFGELQLAADGSFRFHANGSHGLATFPLCRG